MSTFRVWAPNADRVDVRSRRADRRMTPAEDGWFEATADDVRPGDEYRFVLDGGDARPDPRSASQPRGVFGPSALVDHDDFTWNDHDWRPAPLASAVIYELHVGTFTSDGTFEAVIAKLDHLVSLGVTAIELLPVNEFPGEHGWGYDGVNLFAPHHAYGGPEGLKKLVDACHARRLAVIIDVVYNHLGPAGNYLADFGPYFTDKYATPWGSAVNFDDAYSIEVREFFVANALMWLRDYHCDGLRLDAIHAIVDSSAIHFLEQLTERVKELQAELGRELYVIAESDLNDPRVIQRRAAGGYGLDAQWSDDFHHALHARLTGEPNGYYADFGDIEHIAQALQHAFVYGGRYSRYRKRVHGRAPAGLSGHRFLGYLQNHDQVGNRAAGDRSSALMSTGLLKVGAALVLTSPFVPLLFMGEEWGATTPFLYFMDHEPQLGKLVSEGRRSEFAAFGWDAEDVPDPQDPETFERSKLDWDELAEQPHADLLEWHRSLIRLRKATPALTDGRMGRVKTRYDEKTGWLMVQRGPITIACNLAPTSTAIPVPRERTTELLASSAKTPEATQAGIELQGESVAIWKGGTT